MVTGRAGGPEAYCQVTGPGAANFGNVTNCNKIGKVYILEDRGENRGRNRVMGAIWGYLNRGDFRGQKCNARQRNAGKEGKMGRKSKISMEIMGVFGWK